MTDLAKLADAIDRQFSDPSTPPHWDDFSDDDWKAIARALRPATDLEAMLAMLARVKIEFERRVIPADCQNAGCTALEVERGYINFVSLLIFDPDGALVSVEAYE